MSSTVTKDGRVGSRIQNYRGFWDEKDLSKDNSVDARVENYTEVINGYYDGATELYEWGWAACFHFSRIYKGESFYQSIARHEHYLASHMNIKPGMRVLDVGCGVGGPAREIAHFTDAFVTGVNNNDFQIGRARKYTAKAGLQSRVNFVKGDFMKLAETFGENSFDAVYAIEATVHAPSFDDVYAEIKKVLKPGGIFGVYEWCMTDDWDPSNPEHKEIAHRVELGNGIPQMRSVSTALQAISNVGFELLHHEDLAARDDKYKWYYPLQGDMAMIQTWSDLWPYFRTTKLGIMISMCLTWILETFGLVPKGTHQVALALVIALESLVEGGRKKLFTPMLLMIARKPEQESVQQS